MASSYIHRTNSGGSGTTATVSFWTKLNQVTADGGQIQFYTDNSNFMGIYANPTVKFRTYISSAYSSGDMVTYIKHRDPAAWYHYVFVFDTTNGVAADRMRLWINGVRVIASEMNSPVNPSSSYSFTPLVSGSFQINRYNGNSTYSDHDYSHIHYCDGYAYDASYFGEFDSTSGIWKINTSPSVSYGTNGVFLKMEDRTNLDLDSSPNAHTMTTAGTVTPTYDNPSNNFCTINPISYHVQTSLGSLANGNTTGTTVSSGHWGTFVPTLGADAGKWYIEGKVAAGADISLGVVSMADAGINASTSWYIGQHTTDTGYQNSGDYYVGGSSTSGWSTYTSGDIMGMALDLDNRKIYFHKNGVYEGSGDPAAGTNGLTVTADAIMGFAFGGYNGGSWNINYGNGYFGTTAVSTGNQDDAGEGDFEYDVPAGYYTLCTKNIKAYGG
jgi:hypothetical protein